MGGAGATGTRRSVEPYALQRFSTLAMVSVLALVITGIVNSLRHLDAVDQLWQSRYGLTLMIKLALVAATLAAAAVSRRRLQQHRVPPQSVRIEAALTVASSSSPRCSVRPHRQLTQLSRTPIPITPPNSPTAQS